MPRFYFDVSDGRCSPDVNGLYLTDDMAARREAVRRVAMLLRATHSANGREGRSWRGLVLHRSTFRDALHA